MYFEHTHTYTLRNCIECVQGRTRAYIKFEFAT